MTIKLNEASEKVALIAEKIGAPLTAFNLQKTGVSDRQLLAVEVTQDGEIIGGLTGHTGLGWMFIDMLFIPDSLRGGGFGRKLVGLAEQEAKARGCHSAWLDTYEFQAKNFYEKLGYEVFGQLEDYPVGFTRYFLKRSL